MSDKTAAERLLAVLISFGDVGPAPAKIALSEGWYEVLVGIGCDETATILIHKDALETLLERNHADLVRILVTAD